MLLLLLLVVGVRWSRRRLLLASTESLSRGRSSSFLPLFSLLIASEPKERRASRSLCRAVLLVRWGMSSWDRGPGTGDGELLSLFFLARVESLCKSLVLPIEKRGSLTVMGDKTLWGGTFQSCSSTSGEMGTGPGVPGLVRVSSGLWVGRLDRSFVVKTCVNCGGSPFGTSPGLVRSCYCSTR